MLIYHAPIELVNSRKICWSSLSLTHSLGRLPQKQPKIQLITFAMPSLLNIALNWEHQPRSATKKCTTFNTFAIWSGNRPIKLCNKVSVWISFWPKIAMNMQIWSKWNDAICWLWTITCFFTVFIDTTQTERKNKRWSTTAKEH